MSALAAKAPLSLIQLGMPKFIEFDKFIMASLDLWSAPLSALKCSEQTEDIPQQSASIGRVVDLVC
ncbi:hypothetical protein BST95_10585 [Halioglobus japonicus]|uniref:Uncharacterized protein n=1 Tax=Halioglobus japonicus TaxID=930805 RepID=A0AAP8SNH8_9GAMM|nr:hypothetical protein BST95_10585 [Halioglobus japonicus]PLW86642.1 hypothetical protein C0029_09615 [Halioglobus japonicus]